MFELIVNTLTDSNETSMMFAIDMWGKNQNAINRILKGKEVGCSTHHCDVVPFHLLSSVDLI